MNALKVTTILTALCASSAQYSAAQATQKFTANKASEYALVYSLPLTQFDITIETEHTITTPGEFNNYAKRHLDIADAITKPQSTVVVKSINITPRGVADPANRWQVQFKSGTQASMLLTEAGVPLAINLDEVKPAPTPELPKAVPAAESPLESDAARQAVTLEISRATSLSKKAELTAQRIFELREQRSELISGNAENMPADGGALKVALENLDAQEKALTAMFAGVTQTFTEVSTVTFTPTANDSTGVVIARISPTEGIVGTNDLTGMPLYLDFKVTDRAKLPVNEKGEEKRFPKGGVAYTIPGSASISLSFEGAKLGEQTYPVAQLGVTFGLDPSLFTDKKAPMFVEFSPVTGAVVRLDNITPQ